MEETFMTASTAIELENAGSLTDEEVVERVLAGETGLYEILMRRHNQRLYRVGRAILRNDSEAEDVMQDAYVRAFQHLSQFAGRAKFSTWLTRIAVHEALARVRKGHRFQEPDANAELHGDAMNQLPSPALSPEQNASVNEVSQLLEQAVESLPQTYRTVFVLRDVEEMTTSETAEALEISEANVKTRLHRAHALLRRELYARTGAKSSQAFQFHAVRCDRVVANVFRRIAQLPPRNIATA